MWTVSIHAPRAGRDVLLDEQVHDGLVSIHAPRAGRDLSLAGGTGAGQGFNPRAPRGARRRSSRTGTSRRCFNPRAPRGARPWSTRPTGPTWQFQSTRPARGATQRGQQHAQPPDVSIHAPRAGRDGLALTYTIGKSSSHRSADPPAVPPATRHADPSPFANLKPDRRLRFARTSLDSSVRLGSALHTISGPSGSYDGLAPTCSTRPFQFSPRK